MGNDATRRIPNVEYLDATPLNPDPVHANAVVQAPNEHHAYAMGPGAGIDNPIAGAIGWSHATCAGFSAVG